jgi:hypothetical protein
MSTLQWSQSYLWPDQPSESDVLLGSNNEIYLHSDKVFLELLDDYTNALLAAHVHVVPPPTPGLFAVTRDVFFVFYQNNHCM